MAKRHPISDETPPDLTKEQGKKVLFGMKEKGDKILAHRPISSASYDTWQASTLDYIKRTFGSHNDHINTFVGPIEIEVTGLGEDPGEQYREQRRARQLTLQIAVVASLIDQLETDIGFEAPTPPTPGSPETYLWPVLHAKTHVAKDRFAAGQYADAAESALKDLNNFVKELVKRKSGKELDGADLMHQAFSPKAPIIVLADLSTESGRNEQQGYMEIFAGTITGIRNPKAHGNLTITKERAIHFLFLVSLLFSKMDERP